MMKSKLTKTMLIASVLAGATVISGCAGSASAGVSTTCSGGSCSTTAKAEVTMTFRIDHEGNMQKELYAYVGDELVALDFSQFGINYSGQNGFVVAQPGYVDVILKSFGNEVARKTFAYHIDAQSTAKFSNPTAVKNWILTFDGIDEFNAEMSDVQASFGTGSVAITSSTKYSGVTYASSTYSGSRGNNDGGGGSEMER